jgi:DHA1 family multidrug resistance protein-like MFS transporter
VTSAWQFLALRFVQGLFLGGVQPAAYAIIGRLAPRGQQGTAYGLTFSATAMGHFVGPVLSGIVGATFGLRPVFVYTALLVAADAAWVAVGVPKVGGTDVEQPPAVPSEDA